MNEGIRKNFPKFAARLDRGSSHLIEHVLKPLSVEAITNLEKELGIPLPNSYKIFLQCTRGFWALRGAVQLSNTHPFFHEFPPFEQLPETQKNRILQQGRQWPLPSQGMLCFAEFFMEGDGDQLLFDVSKGLINGEYPVYYYNHEDTPPSVRKLANSFEQWFNEFLGYEAFQ